MDQHPTPLCACGFFFQAQRTVTELQAQLDLLKDSTEAPTADTEDVTQLKVRQSVTCANCNKLSLFVLFFFGQLK